jgi:sugar diacid utilization regulator/GAF domain-containing protein
MSGRLVHFSSTDRLMLAIARCLEPEVFFIAVLPEDEAADSSHVRSRIAASWGLSEDVEHQIEEALRAPLEQDSGRPSWVGHLASTFVRICGAGSCVAVEVRFRGISGLFFAASRSEGAFSEADLRLLDAISETSLVGLGGSGAPGQARAGREELEGLLEVSKEITTLGSLDRVLSLVCRKSAELLNVPIAYIALVDQEGQGIQVCSSYGIQDPEWLVMRMPVGEGVGGLVAKTRQPLVIDDYMSFDHPTRAEVKGMVVAEGIRSNLCVPLEIGDGLIGVLYVAARQSNRFSSRDVRLLQGFADQAAVAIANSRMYEQERREAEAHGKLTAILTREPSFVELAENVRELVGNPVALYDSTLHLLAASPASPGGDGTEVDAFRSLVESRGSLQQKALLERVAVTGRSEIFQRDQAHGFAHSRIVAPASSGKEVLGYVHVLEVDRLFDEHDVRLADRASVVLALRMLSARVAAEVEQRLRGDLLDDLLSDNSKTVEAAIRRSVHLGFDLDGSQVVFVVEIRDRPASATPDVAEKNMAMEKRETLLRQVKKAVERAGKQTLVGLVADHAVCLISCPEDEDDFRNFVSSLSRSLRDVLSTNVPARIVTIGLGSAARSVSQIKRSYAEALVCVRMRRDNNPELALLAHDDMGVLTLFRDVEQLQHLQRFVDKHLGAIMSHDNAHRASLLPTLECYLDCACNKAAAAKNLHVHLNTLKYRLERIGEMTGLDLGDPDIRFSFQLALKARHLLGNLDGRS